MMFAVALGLASAMSARADTIVTTGTGNLFSPTIWDMGLPGAGDTAVISATHTADTTNGTPNFFAADELQINGTLRTNHDGSTPLNVNDLILNSGGELWGHGGSTTKVIVNGTLTLNGGTLRSRDQTNRTLKIEADAVVAAGQLRSERRATFLETRSTSIARI
jgi:hypothetical protein